MVNPRNNAENKTSRLPTLTELIVFIKIDSVGFTDTTSVLGCTPVVTHVV